MFRRKSESESASEASHETTKDGGKGHPTPKRKEAEAAARARARAPKTKKQQMQRQRQARSESSRKIREGMKAGDERYLLPRDKGPVRRFVRDYIDSRLSILEMMIPVMVVVMILGFTGQPALAQISSVFMFGVLMLAVLEMFFLRFRLSRELRKRFPDGYGRTTFYAVTRAINLRFMRMPKPKVRLGQELSDTYR